MMSPHYGAEGYILLALLCAAAFIDVRHHRVPNSLCLCILVIGITLQAAVEGLSGIMSGFAGLVVGLLALLPFYMRGGMGAGDVKLMAAAGTFLGPYGALAAALLALIAGGAFALGVVAYRVIISFDATGIVQTARSTRFPFAAAIGAGCMVLILASHSPSFPAFGGSL
jgi:prepilin peptidase CpaA